MAFIIFDLDETLIAKERFWLNENDRDEDEPVYASQETDHIVESTERYIEVMRPLPGVMEVLPVLQEQGHKLALVTSRKEGFQERPEFNAFKSFFQITVGLSETMRDKQTAFQAVLRQANFTPAETIIIGDASGDYEAACAVGPVLGVIAACYYINNLDYELREYRDPEQSRPANAPYTFEGAGNALEIPGLVAQCIERGQHLALEQLTR